MYVLDFCFKDHWGRRTTWRLVLELSFVGLQAIAEVLLVEDKHVSLRQHDRDICAVRGG